MNCVLVLLFVCGVHSRGLQEQFTWTKINFKWPERSGIIFPGSSSVSVPSGRNYIAENNIPMGANVWKNKLFITIPRRRDGVPSTLNYVWLNSTQKHDVPLIPYPNLETNQYTHPGTNNGLVSVYRTAVDSCNRLWMVDTGLLEIPNNRTVVQAPSIVIIDLNTDQIIRRHTLKSSVFLPTSTLATIVLDETPRDCHNIYAYLPDLSGYGLIVYSMAEDDSWRVTHNYFYLEPMAGEFLVGGQRFQWNDGIFSVALTEPNQDGYKTAYFHSMAGTHLYSVSTKVLRNQELATRNFHGNDFRVVVDRGQGAQTSSSDLHPSSGVLFLALVNQNALGCWNTRKSTSRKSFDVIHRDDQKFIYPCDVKMYEDQVIVLTNTMPVFLYGQLNYDETNFRVWMANVNDAVKDTTCANTNSIVNSNTNSYYGG